MSLTCGIVGLPNVGKSTLFNAITKSQSAQAANYPFCTIDPNSGRIFLNDERLIKLAKLAGSEKIIQNYIEIHDIAGLVKGASKGEGLGNKFLSHIREVDSIIHLVRCFEDGDVTHVEGGVDPIRDIEIINTELCLADIELVEKAIVKVEKKAKAGDKQSIANFDLLKKIMPFLTEAKFALNVLNDPSLNDEDRSFFNSLGLLTAKKIVYVANLSEEEVSVGNKYSDAVKKYAMQNASSFSVVSAKIESELCMIEDDSERAEFLEQMGIKSSTLDILAEECFKILNLITFFTIGPKEARAWTLQNGLKAPQAAGRIHSDFEKGFIKAEVISYPDYISCGSEQVAKEQGKLRLEGKDYVIIDGDICHFKFNV